MSDFLHMGGYALFVWSSYLLVAVVLVANVIVPLRNHRRLLAEIARRVRSQQGTHR